jgi:hypothetical protein
VTGEATSTQFAPLNSKAKLPPELLELLWLLRLLIDDSDDGLLELEELEDDELWLLRLLTLL